MVDDPYTFGQIAAANALSDVYAMGGSPTLAMNLLCYPSCLTPDTVRAILAGGADKVREAGAVIAGGHTIEDNEPKYGLSVSGFAHPARILKNSGAQTGDVLVLTKPLGVGILTTAQKVDLADTEAFALAVQGMTALNRTAAEIAARYPVHACTDVTGFGLLGHAFEMADGSKRSIRLFCDELPLLPTVRSLAEAGMVPGGAYANFSYLNPHVDFNGVPGYVQDILCDPQTSGGLLLSVPQAHAGELLRELQAQLPQARVVGEVLEQGEKAITVR